MDTVSDRRPHPDRNGAKPFSFVMQIDCAAVPAPARVGMLLDRGVLNFFLDLTCFPSRMNRRLAGCPDLQGFAAMTTGDGLSEHARSLVS
jgi:hypothetical protein